MKKLYFKYSDCWYYVTDNYYLDLKKNSFSKYYEKLKDTEKRCDKSEAMTDDEIEHFKACIEAGTYVKPKPKIEIESIF